MRLRHRLAGLTALAAIALTASLVILPTAAQAESAPCAGPDLAIRNRSGDKYISVEMNRTGNQARMLRARASTVGSWERFRVCPIGSGYHVLYSMSAATIVRVNLNFPGQEDGLLTATGSSLDGYGTAEQFRLDAISGGTYGAFFSRTAGKFVIDETGFAGEMDGTVRAASADSASYRTHWTFHQVY